MKTAAALGFLGQVHASSISAGLGGVWQDIWPLLIIGTVAMPLGLWVFGRGEVYAKKHGKLKRSG